MSTVKKYLSFDVGARCLAFSVLEYNFDTTASTQPWSKLKISHIELVDVINEIYKNKVVRKGCKPKNAKNTNIHILCQGILKILQDRIHLLDNITDIRVEQQPMMRGKGTGSVGSVRFKIIQHVILTFFEVYYMFHPNITKPIIMPASPANKLKCIIDKDNFCTEPLPITNKDTDYKQRKQKAVDGFTELVEWCDISPQFKNMFLDLSKQNDIADCCLQAIFELQTFGSNISKKLNKPKIAKKEKKVDDTAQPKKERKKRSAAMTTTLKEPKSKKRKVTKSII